MQKRSKSLSDAEWLQLLQLIVASVDSGQDVRTTWPSLVKQFPRPDGSVVAKDEVIAAFRKYGEAVTGLELRPEILRALQLKPQRTMSGVAPVTVLTKPFPCPGQCIFCPSDVRMPKSYLSDEPGAQRAERNYFDPYLQTYNRLQAFANIGHPIQKAELIVLGGTWSYYPESYQIWFIKECFRALNDFGRKDGRAAVLQHYQAAEKALLRQQAHPVSDDPLRNRDGLESKQIDGNAISQTYNQVISQVYVAPERKLGLDIYQQATWTELFAEHLQNETATNRCVGLVVETRPDNISEAEVLRMRKLGCTKTQIGFQSLQDSVLHLNKRGHDVAATRRAVKLLRQAGFKIHGHWMANLYGSSVTADETDFRLLFDDLDFRPDELKIYPCSLIKSAELMQYYEDGRWQPYSEPELMQVLVTAMSSTPRYCRLTRVIRDIPSPDIVVGNKKTNFRQLVETELRRRNLQSQDIRAREVRDSKFDAAHINISHHQYATSVSTEIFIEALAKDKLLGFVRLSLPKEASFVSELAGAAILREVHVYGPALKIGSKGGDQPQHLGLGRSMIAAAQTTAQAAGYKKLAVISAVGTREYYRKLGFVDGALYQFLQLD